MFDKFSERHIGVSNEKELKAMLETIGVKSVDELISQVIPHSIRLKKPLALPAEGMSENIISIASAAAVASSSSEQLPISMPVSEITAVWKFSSASRRPCEISA